MGKNSDIFKGKEKVWDQSISFVLFPPSNLMHVCRRSSSFYTGCRTRDEYFQSRSVMTYHNRGHIQQAINIPAGELESRLDELKNYKIPKSSYMLFEFPRSFRFCKNVSRSWIYFRKSFAGGLWDLR
jgi:hypothetical protein